MTKKLADIVTLAVRAEVRRQGVTQRWIATRLGLSQAQIWERLHGSVEWRTSELDELAAALGVPVGLFFLAPAEPAERAS